MEEMTRFERREVDRNRLATALSKRGIHSFYEAGRRVGHSTGWFQKQLKDYGSLTVPAIASLEMLGISYDEIKPLQKVKPVAKAPKPVKETIGDMTPQELYSIMKSAFIEALNAGKEA